VLHHRQGKISRIEYDQSGNSLSVSFSLNASSTSASQSQNSPTAPSQEPDSEQIVTEDDLLGLLDSVPWSLEDYDSINLVNNHSQNLAHLCSQLRYRRLLIAVIERGIDIHAKDVNGWSPLNFAQLHRDEDAMDILQGDWEDSILNISSRMPPTDPLLYVKPGCVCSPSNAIQSIAKLLVIVETSRPRP
jgi:hypothetical protein